MDVWLVLIILHATSAVICFVSGLAIISPTRAKRRPWLLSTCIASLLGMITFMVAATIAHWHRITIAEQIIFPCLAGLGLYMLYRGLSARKRLRHEPVRENYIDDVGFILISLFNGFVVVLLIDLSTPGWLIAVGVVLAVAIGTRSIQSAKRRYLV